MTQEELKHTVDVLCRTLVAEYSPSKIILFGSHAGGNPTEDSDIDLLIIKETNDRFLDRSRSVRRILSGKHKYIPLDPIVLTPDEIEGRLAIGDQFIGEIIAKGKVLYAA